MKKSQTIIEKVIRIMNDDYPYVKESIIELEVYTGKLSKRSVHELRDAFDHFFIVLSDNTSDEDALKSIDAIQEHLRRAAVEPLECISEQEKIKLLKMQKYGFWWWRLFFLRPPNTEEFVKEIYRGNDFLIEGRKNKAISIKICIENMKSAYVTFSTLRQKYRPQELNSRIFAVVLALVFMIIGLILPGVIKIISNAITAIMGG